MLLWRAPLYEATCLNSGHLSALTCVQVCKQYCCVVPVSALMFLKSRLLPAPRHSRMSPFRWGTAVRIWTACFCVLWPPLGSGAWLCVAVVRRPHLCLIGLGRDWMTQLFAGAQLRPDWHSAGAKLALCWDASLGKCPLQSSSTSPISCCLAEIRIITAAHPASHCHRS